MEERNLQKAIFAGGCFWCMQGPFDALEGVVSTHVGYIGGHKPFPTYEEVSSGKTGHAEAIEVTFDPSKVSYRELLDVFWRNIDPTTENRQFSDAGSQYRTAIFYLNDEQRKLAEESREMIQPSFDKPIVTEIVPATEFYPAEDYHQRYYQKNPVRYSWYHYGSGRSEYLKKKWGEDH